MRFAAVFLLLAGSAHCADWREQAVIELTQTPNARLHPVPVRAVTLRDGFWKTRQDVTIQRSIPTLLALLEEHGVVDNFRRIGGQSDYRPRRGPLYTDSDLYKWIEGAAWSLQTRPDAKLEATIDKLVDEILAAQEPSGYLNTWFVEEREPLRFRQMNSGHELYCLGHMIQGAVAYYRATGKRKLLDGGIRFADYLLKDFGPAPKRPLLTGHPELELALTELYRVTGKRAYLDLAGYLLSGVEKDRLKLRPRDTMYMFSGIPFTSREQFEGHAVRALYAATGAADYWLETGNPEYKKTLDRLWTDLTTGKVFVTGGVGSRASGEAFGDAWELPNRQAYTESCASIASFIFNQRMLAGSGDAKYSDVMERALYNGINSGMSLDGTLYCYRNPLAVGAGETIRNPWYDTCCCPPNLQRTFTALGGYFYSTSKEGIWVHLYDNNAMDWKLESGTALKLETKSGQPFRGNVEMTLSLAKPEEFTLHLRIPAWSLKTKVLVNGQPAGGSAQANTYLALKRGWKSGDRVTMELDMTTRLVRANPRVPEDYGKAAVQRGPLVYCLEQGDNGATPVSDVALSEQAGFTVEAGDVRLGGATVLRHKGRAWNPSPASEPLYGLAAPKPAAAADLTFVPYYTFHNRGASAMTVWIPLLPQ